MNTSRSIKVFLLFSLFIMIFAGIGALVGQLIFNGAIIPTLVIFLFIAGAINLISYFFCHKIVLRAYRARIVNENEAPQLHGIVRDLSLRASLPMPQIAIIPEINPNAFATGRNPDNSVVAVTDGLLRTLDSDELKGVLAHEMAHIKNRDMLVMSLAATLASAISFIAHLAFFRAIFGGRDDGGNAIALIFIAVTAPIAAMLIQLAISRSREYSADAEGARITGDPKNLAKALKKISTIGKRNPMKQGNPSYSPLFISNPLKKRVFSSLFSTHPPMEERIRRLENLHY